MQIKIGADELILWLRKNQKAEEETTINLGLKIRNLIESYGGELTKHDEPCYWAMKPYPQYIDKDKLPKSASQYLIDSTKIGDLYITIFGW